MSKVPQIYLPKPLLKVTLISLPILILLSNLMIIQFAVGYFSYYGMSPASVNFVPQVYDYVRISRDALIATAVTLILTYGSMKLGAWSGDSIGRKIHATGKISKGIGLFISTHKNITRIIELSLTWGFKYLPIGVLLLTVWFISFVRMPQLGEESARHVTQYSSISTAGELRQEIIIYKNSEGITTKIYNTETKSFENGYKFRPNVEYNARTINK